MLEQRKWLPGKENSRSHQRYNSEYPTLVGYTQINQAHNPENTPNHMSKELKKKNNKKQHSCTIFQVTQPLKPKANQLNDSAVWQPKPDIQPQTQKSHSRRLSCMHSRKPSITFKQILDAKSRDTSCDAPTQPSTIQRVPQKRELPFSLVCDEQVEVESYKDTTYSNETIQYLMLREMESSGDSDYLRKHPALTNLMRAILIDWMMEVCMEFQLKRDTFHLAVKLVDRFLSLTSGVLKVQLQLIGVCGLLISSKIEEPHPPSITDFAKSTDYGYTKEQIIQMETVILTELKFQTTLPTINLWLNWYCAQWDLHVSDPNLSFKSANEDSYKLYRQLCQLIDCSILELETIKFKQRQTLAAFMYLVLALKFEYMDIKQIIEQVPFTSMFLLDQNHRFNRTFAPFVLYNFGFNLPDLLPNIQYCSKFFHLKITYDVPPQIHENQFIQEGNYEEFLSFQTHSQSNLHCIKMRK